MLKVFPRHLATFFFFFFVKVCHDKRGNRWVVTRKSVSESLINQKKKTKTKPKNSCQVHRDHRERTIRREPAEQQNGNDEERVKYFSRCFVRLCEMTTAVRMKWAAGFFFCDVTTFLLWKHNFTFVEIQHVLAHGRKQRKAFLYYILFHCGFFFEEKRERGEGGEEHWGIKTAGPGTWSFTDTANWNGQDSHFKKKV